MLRAAISRPDFDDPELAAQWRRLAGAGRASPFLTWDWVGCLAAERYDDPVLVRLHDGPALAGIALFNRRPGRWGRALHLHETGVADLDTVFIEHNGIVSAPGQETALLGAALRAVTPLVGRVVLSGVDDAWLAAARAAGGSVGPVQTRPAPFAALGSDPHAAALSRNTRAQLARSDRSYAAGGPLRASRAADAGEALDWFETMLRLHLDGRAARGLDSSLRAAPIQRFLRALIVRGVPAGTVDLLRIEAGERRVGHLMNLVCGRRVATYQGGFDYADARGPERPGLTSHHAAIERARAEGAAEYDFLAGDDRYKRSLGTGTRSLHWLSWYPARSLQGWLVAGRRMLTR